MPCIWPALLFSFLSQLLFLPDNGSPWTTFSSQLAADHSHTTSHHELISISIAPRAREALVGHGPQFVTPLNRSHYEVWTHSHDVVMGTIYGRDMGLLRNSKEGWRVF